MSDGGEVAVEVDNPNSNIVRRFVRGDGPDELIAWYEGSGTTSRRFAGLDERNSIVSATDGSGSLIGINAYDEYGIPASSNIGRMQYTGQMWLPEAGVTYSKARNYLPSSGVFAQTDPIRTDGGVNLYGYVLNDPVNLADPSGLVCDAYTWVCGHRLPDLSSWWEFLNHNFFEPPRRRIDNFIDIFEKPPQKGPGHFYQSKKLLCTVAPGKPCHIERTGSEVCVIPGHISTEQVISGDWYAAYGSYGDLMPGGFVTTERTGPHSYRNTTTWAHPLSGTVDRIFTQDRSGNIYVTTIGQGTAATALQDSANQKRGPEIFAQQDELCSAILGGK